MVAATSHRAFISYSHAADARWAAALERRLPRVGQPWWRPPPFRVFRDTTNLAASAALWPNIVAHLERCDWFILMASPAAAASEWVGREVAWWLAERRVGKLLIAVTDGEIAWDPRARDFDWHRTNCLPSVLRGRFAHEPLYVDLRRLTAHALTLRDPRFRDAVLSLAAPLHGLPKNELDGAEAREHRGRITLASIAAGTVVVLGLASALLAWSARVEAQRAEANWREAESRKLAGRALDRFQAERDSVENTIKLALMAWQLAPTDEAQAALERIARNTSAMAAILGQHTAGLVSFAFSPDSKLFATLGREGAVQVWHVGSWHAATPTLPGALSKPKGVAIDAHNGHLVTWGEDAALEVWNLATRERRAIDAPFPVDDRSRLRDVAVAPGGTRIAVGAEGGKLALWDAAVGRWRRPVANLGKEASIGLRFDETGRLTVVLRDGGLRTATWDASTDRYIAGPQLPRAAFSAHYVEVSFDDMGHRFVAVGDGNGSVHEIEAGRAPRLLFRLGSVHNSSCNRARLSGGGGEVWMRTIDEWQRWDLANAERPAASGKMQRFTCSDWSPDGRWRADVVQGGWSADDLRWQRVLLWDLSAPATPGTAKAITTECSFEQAQQRCAEQLCARVAPTLDHDQLRKLFGIQNFVVMYDRYSEVTGGPLCQAGTR